MTHEEIYVVRIEHEEPYNKASGGAIMHLGEGCQTLKCCQAYAQVLTKKGHGAITIGRFVPVSKQEQREIKNGKEKRAGRIANATNERRKNPRASS